MKYRVEIKESALKNLKRIPQKDRDRIDRRILLLGDDPRPPGVLAMQGNYRGCYRIRVGNYRIVYKVFDKLLIVSVIEAGDRKDIY